MLGADDYLTKPINEDDLMAVVAGKTKRSMKNKLINERLNFLNRFHFLHIPLELSIVLLWFQNI